MTDRPARTPSRWWRAVTLLILLLLSVLPGAMNPVSGAQGVAGTPAASTPSPVRSPAGTPTPGNADPDTFAAYGYDDVDARGMHASVDYYFPLPRSAAAAEAGQLDLVYSHSPLLIPDRSTMTVLVDDQTITSVRLAQPNGLGGHLSVPLSIADADSDSINVRLSFSLRLTRDECEVADDPALWVTIHGVSTVSFVGGTATSALPLNDVAALFRSRGNEPAAAPTFVLPESPAPATLDAGGIVAYQLGRWSGQATQDPLLGELTATAPPADGPAILIGPGNALPLGEGWGPLAWDGQQFLLDGVPVPPDDGVLALRQQPVPHLLVSGATDEAVRKAALALTRPLDGAIYDSSAVVITGEALPVATGQFAWEQGAASFAELGVATRAVTGPGEHFLDLPFERPADWTLRDGGTLQVQLDVSPAIRLETSWVRAVVNGIDVGAQPLRSADQGVDRYVFVLPAGQLNSGLEGRPVRDLNLQLRIFLDVPHEACVSDDPQKAWASLLPTSAWVLPNDEYEGMDIGRFPGPFAAPENPASAGIVVPDGASPEEILSALHITAALGRWDAYRAPMVPQILTPLGISADALGARPLILVGGPNRNSLAHDVDEPMLTDLRPPAYADSPAAPYGLLRLAASPWSSDWPLLIVAGSGPQNEGARLAATALGAADTLTSIQGTGVVVTGADTPQEIVGASPPNTAPADLSPYVIQEGRPWIERIPAWQVIGAILLVTFIVLVVGVVVLRWVRAGAR